MLEKILYLFFFQKKNKYMEEAKIMTLFIENI